MWIVYRIKSVSSITECSFLYHSELKQAFNENKTINPFTQPRKQPWANGSEGDYFFNPESKTPRVEIWILFYLFKFHPEMKQVFFTLYRRLLSLGVQ